MNGLDGTKIKVARGSHHIESLRALASAYLDSSPFSLTAVEEPNDDLVWRVRVHREVPVDWSTIVGDAIHNLRSALDHLAWQLVVIGGAQPDRDTCFPIGSASPAALRSSLAKSMNGASPKAHRFIERLRPYRGGNSLLNQLHALDIVDKHRLVLVVGAAQTQLVIKMKMPILEQGPPIDFPAFALRPADTQFPLADGMEVFRVCAAARKDAPFSEHRVVFELAFGDVDEVRGLPLLRTLESLHRHVARIVEIAEGQLFH